MKTMALVLGLGVLALVWLGPLLDVYRASFTAHMLAHMGVVAFAAPLLAAGLAGTKWDISWRLPRLFSPLVASLLDLVVIWFWHVPALREAVESGAAALVEEQLSFLAAGLILWLACLGHAPGLRAQRSAGGAFGLLLTSMHMTLLGALLSLAPRPLYGLGETTCLGLVLSAEQDQQLGGVVMLLIGAAVYLFGGLVLLGRVLDQRAKPAHEVK